MSKTDGGFYMPSSPEEMEFLAQYDPRAFAPVAVTTDLVIFTIRDGRLSVLLVKRAGYPYRGAWALAGGFLDAAADVSLEAAARRELSEETGLSGLGGHLEQLASYGDISRDPRMRIVSVAYLALLPNAQDPAAGSDAADAQFFPVSDVLEQRIPLAFDHIRIIRDGLERARGKLEYTPLATAFCDQSFTLGELQKVYETVWDVELNRPNFRRKVLSCEGFVEETDAKRDPVGRGAPRAQLYRAGDATWLTPPLLRREQPINRA